MGIAPLSIAQAGPTGVPLGGPEGRSCGGRQSAIEWRRPARLGPQGFEAADYVLGGYWVWSKLIENLADVGYDPSTMHMVRRAAARPLAPRQRRMGR